MVVNAVLGQTSGVTIVYDWFIMFFHERHRYNITGLSVYCTDNFSLFELANYEILCFSDKGKTFKFS